MYTVFPKVFGNIAEGAIAVVAEQTMAASLGFKSRSQVITWRRDL